MSKDILGGNISEDQLNAALKMASAKLGVTPEQLKKMLSDQKSAEELMNSIGAGNAYRSARINPEQIEAMLRNNPKARQLISELMEKKKD